MIGGPNVVFLNGHQWKKQRMTANPAFRRSMPVTMFGNLALDVFALMEEYGNKNLEMHELMERFTLESIGKSGFGTYVWHPVYVHLYLSLFLYSQVILYV